MLHAKANPEVTSKGSSGVGSSTIRGADRGKVFSGYGDFIHRVPHTQLLGMRNSIFPYSREKKKRKIKRVDDKG